MIVYSADKRKFLQDVDSNCIEQVVLDAYTKALSKKVSDSEVASWKNSLGFMHRILLEEKIPDDAGVAIEFNIPRTCKRIDFILTGVNREGINTAIIVELKQWSDAQATTKDGIVTTFLGGRIVETSHPSYQAWSYATLLEDYNVAVRETPVNVFACAYLHNCAPSAELSDPFYAYYLKEAPIFYRTDAASLRQFVSNNVKDGDSGQTIKLLAEAKVRPSKDLSDSITSLIKGNREFILIDEQKVAFETAYAMAKSKAPQKRVCIIHGGPGTGKSVIAINLLVRLTADGQNARYVTKNGAPRAVYQSKLTGSMSKSRFSNLFSGSGINTEAALDTYDTLVVDEAHRLTEKSGMFSNLGENQVKELIEASKCTIFFVDDRQQVTFKDIGHSAEIKKWASRLGCVVQEIELLSQFRCNGSDGYLSWVDDVLEVRPTAHPTLDGASYDFRVFTSASSLQKAIVEANVDNRARTVAGYCWDWKSKKDKSQMDITFSDGFAAQWNLDTDGSLWITKPGSVSEVGCIHTCQGLELNYVGVILGPDIMYRDETVVTKAEARSRMDSTVKGYKRMLRTNKIEALDRADAIIKNTYRTLMTRGQKGCFVYCVDPALNHYLASRSGRGFHN